jgi:5-methylthioadenosine/S-adenosylhomocysteine deaminase
LDGRLLAAHAVHLSDERHPAVRRGGGRRRALPGLERQTRLRNGPLHALRAASVAVGLGTDGPASNDDLDLWEEARLAMMFCRLATADPLALTAEDAFLMATSAEPRHWAGRTSANSARETGRT